MFGDPDSRRNMQALNISREILNSDLSNTDLDAILRTLKMKRQVLVSIAKCTVSPGMRVSFRGKSGLDQSGIVLRILTKNVLVDCGSAGRWRVPANMVSIIQ